MGTRRLTRQTFRSMFNMLHVTDYRITQHPHWMASLTVPGLGHDSFYWNGVPKLNALMSLGSATRLYTLMVPYNEEGDTFMDWERMSRNSFVFISSVKVSLSRTMYDLSAPKHTLNAKFFNGYVGNSSTASPIKFYLPGMTEPLFEQLNGMVTVDKKTRKPSPLPDWFVEKYKGKGVLDQPFIVKPKEKPQDTFVHRVQIQWSDTDVYRHTNYVSYPRFAVDSVEAALWNQHQHGGSALKGLTMEIVDNGVKQVEICYTRQSLLEDVLDVHVWQEEGNNHKVFVSMRHDGVDVCQVHLEYFEKE